MANNIEKRIEVLEETARDYLNQNIAPFPELPYPTPGGRTEFLTELRDKLPETVMPDIDI